MDHGQEQNYVPDELTIGLSTERHWVNQAVFQPLQPGDPKEIGGYRLRARLGEGGMGRVYLSYTPGGRPVAIKVVRDEHAGDPDFRRRFEREIATAQQVQGFYTAPVIDARPFDPQPWLATAYIPGPSLHLTVSQYGALPTESVLVLIAGVAEALASIHLAGVVHRDLKPSNVILAIDGPRVIDFGIAHSIYASSATRTGLRVGTPAYMAPEQVRGVVVTPAADVFALGILACYAVTGQLPFGGGLDPAVPFRILEQEPDLHTCPPALRELVSSCLAKSPDDRPSPTEVISRCQAAATGSRLRMGHGWLPPSMEAVIAQITNASVLAKKPARPTHRLRFALLAAICAVMLIAGTAAVTLNIARSNSSSPMAGPLGTTDPPTTTNVPSSAQSAAALRASTSATTTSPTATDTTSSTTMAPTSATPTTATPTTATPTTAAYPPGHQFGQYSDISIPYTGGINLLNPSELLLNTPADLNYFGQLVFHGQAVVLRANEGHSYQSCTNDTSYVTGNELPGLTTGSYFCLSTADRVALIEIVKAADPPGSFYIISLTVWQH